MNTNELPKMNMDTSETGCCPKFDPAPWDEKTFVFDNKLFVKANTISFLHIPLNIGKVFLRTWKKIQDANAAPADYYLVLSYNHSPWKGEHYFAVEKEVEGEEMVKLSGTYLAKVFEGPYKNAGKWMREMENCVNSQGKEMNKLYFFYTTCPKCAKYYGKNYVVAFSKI